MITLSECTGMKFVHLIGTGVRLLLLYPLAAILPGVDFNQDFRFSRHWRFIERTRSTGGQYL